MREFLRSHVGNRLFEWLMTVAMLLLAVHIFIWPSSIAASPFQLLLLIIRPESLAFWFLLFGLIGIAALIANGAWPRWGPVMRATAAFGRAMIWGQMAAALFMLIPEIGSPPSPDIPVFCVLTIGEFISCYRVLATNASQRP